MKKIILDKQVKIVGVLKLVDKSKFIDFYIEQPGQEKVYAFSKIFTQNTYNLCRSGIRVNDLSCMRSRDKGVMRLVKYLNVILPYLAEYYELPQMAG